MKHPLLLAFQIRTTVQHVLFVGKFHYQRHSNNKPPQLRRS